LSGAAGGAAAPGSAPAGAQAETLPPGPGLHPNLSSSDDQVLSKFRRRSKHSNG
jgi:hypothetical protein